MRWTQRAQVAGAFVTLCGAGAIALLVLSPHTSPSGGEPQVRSDPRPLPASWLARVGTIPPPTRERDERVPVQTDPRPAAVLDVPSLREQAHLFAYRSRGQSFCMLFYFTRVGSSVPITLQSASGCLVPRTSVPIDWSELGGEVTRHHDLVSGVVSVGSAQDTLELRLSDGSKVAYLLGDLPTSPGPLRAGRAFLLDAGTAHLVRADVMSPSGASLAHTPEILRSGG
jgi:hypothetical protein